MSEDDDIRALFFNSVGGPDEHSSTWADAVMSLTRRLKEQAEGTVTSDPFALAITFYAPSRFYQPDWSGVRLGRLSKRYRTLNAMVALDPIPPEDPVAAVIGWAEVAVEEACAYARRRKIADDLPDLREALRRAAEAGPAPVRHDPSPAVPPQPPDHAGEGWLLRVTSSTGEDDDDPSEDFLHELLADLMDGIEARVHLDRVGSDSAGSLHLSRTGRHIELERHDSAADPRLIARTRDDDLVAEVLTAWAFQPGAMPDDLLWQEAT